MFCMRERDCRFSRIVQNITMTSRTDRMEEWKAYGFTYSLSFGSQVRVCVRFSPERARRFALAFARGVKRTLARRRAIRVAAIETYGNT